MPMPTAVVILLAAHVHSDPLIGNQHILQEEMYVPVRTIELLRTTTHDLRQLLGRSVRNQLLFLRGP